MSLSDPVTALTDYALAVVSAGFAVAIGRALRPDTRVSGWFWCAAFVVAAIAATTGGTYHGIAARVDRWTLRALWNVTMFLMGGFAAFVAAAIHAARVRRGEGTIAWLAGGIGITLLGAAVQQGMLLADVASNRNAAYHLVQIAGLYCFFRCARTTRDRAAVTHG